MHHQVGTTPSFGSVQYQPTAVSVKGAYTHIQYHSAAQQKPRRQKQSPIVNDRNSNAVSSCKPIKIGNLRNKPKFHDDIVIELSSDEEFLKTPTPSWRCTQAQRSSPTTTASSPCTDRGKKRYREEDVIVIIDDEESTPQDKKRRRYPSPTRG